MVFWFIDLLHLFGIFINTSGGWGLISQETGVSKNPGRGVRWGCVPFITMLGVFMKSIFLAVFLLTFGVVMGAEDNPVMHVMPSVVIIRSTSDTYRDSIGAGLIVKKDHILTVSHVVSKPSIRVYFGEGGGGGYRARVIRRDGELSLLRVNDEVKRRQVICRFAEGEPELGECVYAIGHPFGFEYTVTRGVISHLRREISLPSITLHDLIQTDAPINLGNSGGPLFNMRGEVVGVNVAIRQNIGFTIPNRSIQKFLKVALR